MHEEFDCEWLLWEWKGWWVAIHGGVKWKRGESKWMTVTQFNQRYDKAKQVRFAALLCTDVSIVFKYA